MHLTTFFPLRGLGLTARSTWARGKFLQVNATRGTEAIFHARKHERDVSRWNMILIFSALREEFFPSTYITLGDAMNKIECTHPSSSCG